MTRHIAWPVVLLALANGCSSRQTDATPTASSQSSPSRTIQTVNYQSRSPDVEQVERDLARGPVMTERPDLNEKPMDLHDWKKEQSGGTIQVGSPALVQFPQTTVTPTFVNPANPGDVSTSLRGRAAVQGIAEQVPITVGVRAEGLPSPYTNQSREAIQASPWMRTVDEAILERKTLQSRTTSGHD